MIETSAPESENCGFLLFKTIKPVGCYLLLQDTDTKTLTKSFL